MRGRGTTLLNKPDTQAPESEATSGCRHFWVIETPNGPVSRGVCRLCGEKKEFSNYITQEKQTSGRKE